MKMACLMALLFAAPTRINAHARVATPLPPIQDQSKPTPTPEPTPEPAAKAASINFEPTEPTLTPRSVVKLKASVINQKGKLIEGGKVTWKIDPTDPKEEETARKYIKVVQGTDGATVLALSQNLNLSEQVPEFVGIMATSSTEPPVTGIVYVRLQFAQYRHLDARVELMGDTMVEDLFGKKVREDFYVAMVYLRNKLGDMQNGGGEPVIASSDSIEVAVAFEEMPDDDEKISGESKKKKKKWNNVEIGGGHKNQSGCEEHPWVYRPYANNILESTVDRRDSANWRTRALAIASSSSILASAVTAIAVPKPGSDLPVGLEKFSASLIPGFKEIFPSQKDFHRRSIQQFVMQPTEKIAYGSDFAKAIFFPKSSFRGFRSNAKVRISSICSDFFKVETGVLRTGNASSQQPINTVSGQVKVGDKAIPGVSVTLNNPFVRRTTVTNSEGFYSIQSLPQGDYTMSLSSDLYKFAEQSFKLNGDQKQDVSGAVQTYSLSGEVKKDNTTTPIEGATVRLAAEGIVIPSIVTGSDGKFSFKNLDANRKYTLKITKDDFEPHTKLLGENLTRDTDLMSLPLIKEKPKTE
ncbi:MAG: MSCRAMM family protein [Pyrinomonadaceae bacterium]